MADFTALKRDVLSRLLRKNVRGEVRFDLASRKLYSTDASIYQIEPLGVVIPRDVEDVVTTVQIAAEQHVPITARGGGTSLSGQSIGPGIILDCSKYLNDILDIDPAARIARVRPGVVLDQLNRALAPHNLQFGPEVATASRANLGGMIGNNSAGARSIVYGKTGDHVRQLGVVLADGSQTVFGPIRPAEWDRRGRLNSLEGAIYRQVREVVTRQADEIRRRFPRILRRVSGYNLDAVCDGLTGGTPVGLHQLVVGGEGTLAIVTEAELALVPKPRHRGLLIPHFDSLAAAMASLDACLEMQPSAVELLDRLLIELAQQNLGLRDTMAALRGRPAALLMVEFSGDDAAEVADRLAKLQRRLGEAPGVTALVVATDPAQREPLWNLRRAAVPLLLGMHGDRKPVTFVEDTAVPPARLPEFVARFRDILHRHDTDGAFYGHASVGCLHIRPILNLKDSNDIGRMRRITEDITDLVLEFGGALSGEHGDGLARSEWNRKMFGPVVYDAFRAVKRAFDPHGLLNPGRVVDAPPMTENLRYGPGYRPMEPATIFDYRRQEGFVRSIELCNGSGVCRKLHGGTMCPSFRATRDEQDSTRGRANALRLALVDPQPLRQLRSRWVYDVLDLCLMCKACKAECPSNVDLAKLKAEFLHFYYQDRPRPLSHRLVAGLHRFNTWGAALAPIVNGLQESRLVRWLLEKLAGIDRRRSLPRLHADHFRRWFLRHAPAAAAGRRGRVFLLDDCFTTFHEPHIGQATVTVLEHAGYAVDLTGLTCCCRPMISKGFLADARELIARQATRLDRRLPDDVPILGMEPSCLLTLVDEWPELVPGEETRRIAAAAQLADGWLARQVAAGQCQLDLRPQPRSFVLHGHCHQKALVGVGGTAAALRLIPEAKVSVLDAGCCGMAGSFGFETEHYDLSVQVANLALLPALAEQAEAVVVAPGTSCRHQIHDLAQRRAWHPMEVLAQSLASGLAEAPRAAPSATV
ncbi:MAG: FAD-binding protein [Gemmataceae bacterium]|nr:FAD-binding protein [Gemmataceae bacterium]MDW8265937.1 FAD-linked oxidase C-terminal domain-containing protein [Gemmataceae bacterium]